MKQPISGLAENESEIGEEKYRVVQNIRIEHNLKGIPPLIGTFFITNYKVGFKPRDKKTSSNNLTGSKSGGSETSRNEDLRISLVGKARVQDYFMIPLGMLFSAEIRTFVGTDNKVKHSCIELMSKDNRKWSLILKYFEEC